MMFPILYQQPMPGDQFGPVLPNQQFQMYPNPVMPPDQIMPVPPGRVLPPQMPPQQMPPVPMGTGPAIQAADTVVSPAVPAAPPVPTAPAIDPALAAAMQTPTYNAANDPVMRLLQERVRLAQQPVPTGGLLSHMHGLIGAIGQSNVAKQVAAYNAQINAFNARLEAEKYRQEQQNMLMPKYSINGDYEYVQPYGKPLLPLAQLPAGRTPDITQFEYAQSHPGYSEWSANQKKAGATNVNVGPNGEDYGKPPEGMAWARGTDKKVLTEQAPGFAPGVMRPIAVPIQGSKEQQTAEKQTSSQVETAAQMATQGDVVTKAIDDSMNDLKAPGWPAAGTTSIPFALSTDSNAGRLRAHLTPITSGVALQRMQQLKQASATGSTGFGQLSEKELGVLVNNMGSLDPNKTAPDILANNLQTIKQQYQAFMDQGRKIAQQYPDEAKKLGLDWLLETPTSQGSGIPSGWTAKEWGVLTPQEQQSVWADRKKNGK